MKTKTSMFVALALIFVGSGALAAQLVIPSIQAHWFQGGLFVGSKTKAPQNTAANKVTWVGGQSATIDFGALAAIGTALGIPCADSSAMTVTGATLGDPCFVGSATAPVADLNLMCFVSAADAVKVRACNVGKTDAGTIDPASMVYYTRVISGQ